MSACNPLSKPQKAGLQVVTDGVESSVFINGDYLEKTPLIKKDLKPGSYNITIKPDDPEYVSYDTTVNVREGLLTVVTWRPGRRAELSGGVIFEMEMLKSKNGAEVSVVSIPDGAIVKLGDTDKEFAPVLYTDLEPGKTDLVVTLPSYEDQHHTIDILPGYRLLISVKLAKQSLDNTQPPTELTATATDSAQTATDSASTEPTQQTSEPEITGPAILIKPTGFFLNGTEVLRVRDKAGAIGKEIGYAPVGQKYTYLNETSSGWFKISFENQDGWVSGQYASLEQ